LVRAIGEKRYRDSGVAGLAQSIRFLTGGQVPGGSTA
jgi:hypothetical protein